MYIKPADFQQNIDLLKEKIAPQIGSKVDENQHGMTTIEKTKRVLKVFMTICAGIAGGLLVGALFKQFAVIALNSFTPYKWYIDSDTSARVFERLAPYPHQTWYNVLNKIVPPFFDTVLVCTLVFTVLGISAFALHEYLEHKTDLQKEDVRKQITSELQDASLGEVLKRAKSYNISLDDITKYSLLGEKATPQKYAALQVLGQEARSQQRLNKDSHDFERPSYQGLQKLYETQTMVKV